MPISLNQANFGNLTISNCNFIIFSVATLIPSDMLYSLYIYINLTTGIMSKQSKQLHLDPKIQEQIALKRQLIQRIKANHSEKVIEANLEHNDSQAERVHHHDSTSTVIDPESIAPYPVLKQFVPEVDKNPGVSDTDKMVFDKKFKNFLNHRQQYLDKARNRSLTDSKARRQKKIPLDLGEAEYYNQEEILSNTGSDYQYQNASDMQAAFEEMTLGKKRKGAKGQLYPSELFENQLRECEFEILLAESEEFQQKILSISKDRLLNYLFGESAIMMLYSINPYQLGDQLADFDTKTNDFLNFQEFSKFLLADREPTYFEYTPQNLNEARKLGRGIKCAPIIAKWIDESGIFQLLVEIYQNIDIRGDSRVERSFLAKKIRKQATKRKILQTEVIEIVNINKKIPLNRLLYEIEFEQDRVELTWSEQEFIDYLQNYKRKDTPEKDKLITRLILTGKYDSSYIYVVSQQAIEIVKDVFEKAPKFAQYFVVKEKFLQSLCRDPRYKKIQSMWVRTETNRYVKKENVEQTLIRMYAQAEDYLDIEEVLDFLTNRGRPKVVEHRVYLENLQRQIALIEAEQKLRAEKYGQNYDTASSDEEFNEIIRKKQKKRKQDKLKQIRNANNFEAGKKFNVTIPIPYAFDSRDKNKKESIRQRKVREMLEQKQRKYQEDMKPLPIKQVPYYVKQNLYDRMLKEQERQRKERLDKFRLDIMAMVKCSDRLAKPKQNPPSGKFTFQDYKFQARPLPWYCENNLLDRINRKKQERREQILEQIINKHTNYELPDGVQRMIKRQEQKEEIRAAKARTASTGSVGGCTFMPRITDGVPDFKTIHEHLHFDLENAKNIKEPIKMEPFSFDNRPAKSKTTYQKPKQKAENMRHSKHERIENQEDYQNIPKTEKFEAMVQLRRKQLIEKEKQKEKEQRSEAVRKLRESKFAPVVWRALKKSPVDPSRSRAIIADRVKEFKREERKKKEQYENQMIRILTKVYQRPLLLESGAIQRDPEGDRPDLYDDEGEYLDGDYEPNEDVKMILEKKRKEPQPHMNDDHRRAIVEGHHLGQYPPEGFEDDYDEDDENDFQEGEMYEEQYEVGNLHTS